MLKFISIRMNEFLKDIVFLSGKWYKCMDT
jgi:hypothetical protein